MKRYTIAISVPAQWMSILREIAVTRKVPVAKVIRDALVSKYGLTDTTPGYNISGKCTNEVRQSKAEQWAKQETIWIASNKEFVKVWQESKSLAEVAQRIGLTQFQCSGKAHKLRAKGVKLQRFKHGFLKGDVNVDELNQLIEEKENER